MKRIRIISTYLLIITLLVMSISPVYVFADEIPVITDEQNTEISNDMVGHTDDNSVVGQDTEPISEGQTTEDVPAGQDAGTGSEGQTTEDVGAGQDTGTGSEGQITEDVPAGQDAGTGSEGQTTEDVDAGQDTGTGSEGHTAEDAAAGQDTESGSQASDTQETEATSATEEIKEEQEVDPDTITAIDDPVETELFFEFKPALDELLKEFPETITVYRGDESETISVNWICDGDYDELLGEYPFIPDMADYILAEDLELPRIIVTFENEGEGEVGGYIETELAYDVPTVSGGNLRRRAVNIPSSYNTYEDRRLPAVRNQNPYGTCWAFATLGAVESDLIADGSGRDVDLSELHLAYYASHNYEDPKGCRSDTVRDLINSGSSWLNNGGDAVPAMRYLSNLVGVVPESEVPYSRAQSFDPDSSYVVSKDSVQIRNAYFIGVEDRDDIKAAIMEHGGVYAAYYESLSTTEYSATYNSYNATSGWPNHAVMIVGWNDSFSKDKFVQKPAGNGAWLVRNSWGQNGYGHSGYFWLSYYDGGFANSGEVVAFDASTDTYDNCYAYDGQPLYDTIYYAGTDSTVTETYNVNAGEAVRGVGFELGSANVTADVTVTNKRTNESSIATVHTTYAGFYTAELENVIEVPDDATVEVAIRYTSDNGESVRVVCECTGSPGTWGDLVYTGVCDKGFKLNGNNVSVDPRMKLYTDDSDVSPTGDEIITLNESAVEGHWKDTLQLSLSDESTVGIDQLTWTSSNENCATVDENGLVTFGPSKGSARIKGTYSNGQFVVCTVTVMPYSVTFHLPDDAVYSEMITEFYPGDKVNGHLPDDVWRTSGYGLAGWFLDEGLTRSVGFYPDIREDIDLYPKWTELTLDVMYYAPNSSFTGYTYDIKMIRFALPASSMPYTLPSASGCRYDPNTFARLYGGGDFEYWSWDAAGKNKATRIERDIFGLHYSDDLGRYCLSRINVCLYPQYKKAVRVSGITLNKSSMTLDKGSKFQLVATVNPSNASNQSVTWSSNNTSVATVTSGGLVNTVGRGTAVITAKTNNGKTATCNITVIREVRGVTLNKASRTLEKGAGYQLVAAVVPSNATYKTISWSSSNTRVATVSSTGYVKATHAGTAVITARSNNGKTATCTISVIRPVTGVSLNRRAKSIDRGGGFWLRATITPSNASDKGVTWSSSNTRVATVSADGYVTTHHTGKAVITVKTNNKGMTASCNVFVTRPVTGVTLNKTYKRIDKGSGFQLIATISPSNASNKGVTWSSNNTRVATVSADGYVTAKHAGTAVITATTDNNGKTATCNISVTRPVTGVTLNKTKRVLKRGKGYQLKATVQPSNASNKAVTWTSSNTKVATVSEDGFIRAVGKGTAVITVKTNNRGRKATCTVTVN